MRKKKRKQIKTTKSRGPRCCNYYTKAVNEILNNFNLMENYMKQLEIENINLKKENSDLYLTLNSNSQENMNNYNWEQIKTKTQFENSDLFPKLNDIKYTNELRYSLRSQTVHLLAKGISNLCV